MKKTYFLIALLFAVITSFAQVPTVQDCMGAIPLCFDTYSTAASYSGTGNYPGEINVYGTPYYDDNCPNNYNPNQKDSYPPSGNGIGDACDCEGDFNCDGIVNAVDAGFITGGFKQRTKLSNPCTNENPCNGDFDCDGDVDNDDKAIFYADSRRGKNKNPCPACEVGDWCEY